MWKEITPVLITVFMGKPLISTSPPLWDLRPFLGFESCQLFHHLHCLWCVVCGGVLLFVCFVFWDLFLLPSCLWDWITKNDSPGTVSTWELKWLHKQVRVLSEISQIQWNGLWKTKASSMNFSGTIKVWLVWDQGSYLAPVCCGEEQL